ncbi:MAG TPA: DUF2007 domain-containing protein [Gemmatimonadota bacterium]|nr:DUF2007 domain-containing protein [Gemmatimonadota bacterium]
MTARDRGDVPVEVARFHWRHEAEMALGILEDEGIPGAVLADDVGGVYPGIGSARLIVPAEHAERARLVLDELGSREAEG